jgi:hypothetical protein
VEFPPTRENGAGMKTLRPTPQQERWMVTASRLRLGLDHGGIAERIGGWTAPSLIARCAFFVLGAVAAGLTIAVFDLMYIPMLLAGLTLLIAAEWLVLRKHLFHAGIEEALWAAGLFAVVLQVMQPSVYFGVRSAALVALVLAIAGLRLLNPLFITLAAAAVSCAMAMAGEHTPGMRQTMTVLAGGFCYATAATALFAGRLELRRPSHDQMLNWLVVIMPLGGYLWLASEHAVVIRVFAALASAILGVAALVLGLRRRTHAPLIACLVCFGCVAYELRNLTALSLKMKLVLWGSAALLAALGLDRYLRTPRRGITSSQVSDDGGIVDIAQSAGAAALSPPAAQRADAPFAGGGGKFGGGGAGGTY